MSPQQLASNKQLMDVIIQVFRETLQTPPLPAEKVKAAWDNVYSLIHRCLTENSYTSLQSFAAQFQEQVLQVFPTLERLPLDQARNHLRGLLRVFNLIGIFPEDPLWVREVFLETLFLEYSQEYPDLFQLHMDVLDETYVIYDEYALDVLEYALATNNAHLLSERFVEDGISRWFDHLTLGTGVLPAEVPAEVVVGYLREKLPHNDFGALRKALSQVPLDSYLEVSTLPLSSEVTAWLLEHAATLNDYYGDVTEALEEISRLPQLSWSQLEKCEMLVGDLASNWYRILEYIDFSAFIIVREVTPRTQHLTVAQVLRDVCPKL